MTEDVTWSFDGITANGLVGSQPDRKLGESGTYTFRFAPDPGIATDHKIRANNVLAYQAKAGGAVVWKTIEHDVRFREQQTASPDLVVEIQGTGADLVNTQDIWGLVMGVRINNDRQPDKRIILDVEVVYLADHGDHADETALRDALEE